MLADERVSSRLRCPITAIASPHGRPA